MKKIFLSLMFLGATSFVFAQSSASIKTSAQCEMCKSAIEKQLKGTKGVQSATLNVDTKTLEVSYDEKTTSLDKIRRAVAKTGYDADAIAADKKAYKKLPDCCKKTGK